MAKVKKSFVNKVVMGIGSAIDRGRFGPIPRKIKGVMETGDPYFERYATPEENLLEMKKALLKRRKPRKK